MTLRSVLILAPDWGGVHTGNETSVRRIEDSLAGRGVRVSVARGSETPQSICSRLTGPPDVVHAFHARRTGPLGLRLAREFGVPLVVTLTGTDVNLDPFHADRAAVVREVLGAAGAVLCCNEAARDAVRRLVGRSDHVTVLRKGVVVPDPLPALAMQRGDAEIVVLQVAHVRRVKNNALAVRAVRDLAAEGLPVRLVILGAELEAEYAAECRAAAGGAEAWQGIRHPPVPFEEVGGWYASADLVLVTSDSEGGSNAVLEAMAHGRAVLGSAVPANVADLGEDGTRGVVYPVRVEGDGTVRHDEEALRRELRRLAADRALRERIGGDAREWVGRHHGAGREVDAVLEAYSRARRGPD